MATTDADVTKSIAFPFNLGSTSFPEMSESVKTVLDSIISLLLTGTNERVMRVDMGTNINEYVFDNLTELTKARIATEVKRAIDLYEPRAQVLAVNVFKEETTDSTIKVDIIYRVAGQTVGQQIPIGGP